MPCWLQVYHKAALVTTRDFWRLLLRDQVNLVRLSDSFRHIDSMESMADKTYKLVLDRRVPGLAGRPAAHGCWSLRAVR